MVPGQYQGRGRGRLPGLLALGVLALLVGAPAARAEEAPAVHTLVVMPFEDRSPSTDWVWLGKGLAEMVTTDLSGSNRLVLLDRMRLEPLLSEMDLAAGGLVDPDTAARLGRLLAADRGLFGSYEKDGDALRIEAHLLDLGTQEVLGVERVEGTPGEVFALEKRLVRQVLERLDVPLSDEERGRVERVATDSLPAFEHFSRGLGRFDRGEWFEAWEEFRLAARADPGYLDARARLAELYGELGEPQHALIEYRRLTDADAANALPEVVYYRMGRLLEGPLGDRQAAAAAYERVLARHPDYAEPFDIHRPDGVTQLMRERSTPAPDDYPAIAAANEIGLKALERLALLRQEEGDDRGAAEMFSRFERIFETRLRNGMHLCPYYWLAQRATGEYWSIYRAQVRKDADGDLFPPFAVHLLPPEGATVDPSTRATNGWTDGWGFFYLAPPHREMASVTFEVDTDAAPAESPYIQVQWDEPGSGKPWLDMRQLKPRTGRQKVKFEAPARVRLVRTWVTASPGDVPWRAAFALRPCSPADAAPAPGAMLGVVVSPHGARVQVDGGRDRSVDQGIAMHTQPGPHTVVVRWPDGISRTRSVVLRPDGREDLFLNGEPAVLSTHSFGVPGSHVCAFTDSAGRAWLVWDQAVTSPWEMFQSGESDLFWSSSEDGAAWGEPRRLPVSSAALDMLPVLCQDRGGTYWLAWLSDRDPQQPHWPWIASSQDGVEWSFPRKVALPALPPNDLMAWGEGHYPGFAFTVDNSGTFWLVIKGHLMQSQDGVSWQEAELLHTGDARWTDNQVGSLGYHLGPGPGGRPLLMAYQPLRDAKLLDRADGWRKVGVLSLDSVRGADAAFAPGPDGTLYWAYGANSGVHLRTLAGGAWSRDVLVDSYLRKAFQPAVTALPDGRCVVAYGSRDGVSAALCASPAAERGE